MNFPFFKKQKKEEIAYDYNEESKIVRFENDGKTVGKDAVEMLETFAKLTSGDIPIYKGEPKIEHAYESDFLGYTDKCPLCNTPTQQMYSNFVWANQEASRLMSAPAGHFCTHCPTVIIDDTLVKNSINKARFQYWGVCAIDSGYSKNKEDINLFQTLNGEKPTYILNEEGGLDGILNSVHAPSEGMYRDPSGRVFGDLGERSSALSLNHSADFATKSKQAANKKAKNKSKNKQAKQSRKANRKK
jgi:hypothetical protein